MALGKHGGGKAYFRVAYGAIRRTCQEGEPDAESRTTKDGKVVWEKVWGYLKGTLIGITHDLHDEWGHSWQLHIDDDQVYVLQIQEDSRYGGDLLKKIPNLKIGTEYTFTPYDFTPKGEEKRKVGFSITDESTGEKVQSHYHKFDKANGKTKIEYLNGFPDPGDTTGWDKDDWKAFNIKATKVMRNAALQLVHEPDSAVAQSSVNDAPAPTEADLPF